MYKKIFLIIFKSCKLVCSMKHSSLLELERLNVSILVGSGAVKQKYKQFSNISSQKCPPLGEIIDLFQIIFGLVPFLQMLSKLFERFGNQVIFLCVLVCLLFERFVFVYIFLCVFFLADLEIIILSMCLLFGRFGNNDKVSILKCFIEQIY